MAQVSKREVLIAGLAARVAGLAPDRVCRVGIDGVDGAGKTTFADELARALAGHGRPVIRASVDAFHNPRATRYRLGRNSPDGFFLESYNYPELRRVLLDPLSPGGSGCYRTAIFDLASDAAAMAPEQRARAGSILVFDGVFLHRPELRAYWDLSIYLDVDFGASVPRGAARGAGFGSPDPAAPANRRYVQGQLRYLRECDPQRRATMVIDNTDLLSPAVVGDRERS